MQHRGIFFDLYGTLLLFGDMRAAWSDWVTAFRHELASAGFPVEQSRLEGIVDGFLGQPEPALAGRGETVFERRVVRACDRLDAALSDDQIRSLSSAAVKAWHNHVSLDPEALRILTQLGSRHRLALVSNFDHEVHVHRVLQEMALRDHFESVVISGEVGFKKPDPRIFDRALAETGLAPSDVCYVGDEQSDVEAARSAGIHPILIRRSGAQTGQSQLDRQPDRGTRTRSPDGVPSQRAEVQTIQSLSELLE